MKLKTDVKDWMFKETPIPTPNSIRLSEYFYNEGFDFPPGKIKDRYVKALHIIIANLNHCYHYGSRLRFPMSKETFKKFRENKKFSDFKDIGHETYRRAWKFLLREGYVVQDMGDNIGTGLSILRPTLKLEKFLEDVTVWESEVIIRKKIKLKKKDKKGYRKISIIVHPRLIREDNQIFKERIIDLRDYNENICLHYIEVPDKGEWIKICPHVRSIYSNGSIHYGGRFYTHGNNYQNIKKYARSYLRIAGKPTVELDYANHHIRLVAHTQLDMECPEDIYDIEGEDRKRIKLVTNILLNAESIKSAERAIRCSLFGKEALGKAPEAKRLLKVTLKRMRSVFGKRIQPLLLNPLAGPALQNLDGDITAGILIGLTVKKGIPCLPMHDSYIVPKKFKNELYNAMFESYFQQTGKFPVVK